MEQEKPADSVNIMSATHMALDTRLKVTEAMLKRLAREAQEEEDGGDGGDGGANSTQRDDIQVTMNKQWDEATPQAAEGPVTHNCTAAMGSGGARVEPNQFSDKVLLPYTSSTINHGENLNVLLDTTSDRCLTKVSNRTLPSIALNKVSRHIQTMANPQNPPAMYVLCWELIY